MSNITIEVEDDAAPCECWNCGWTGPASDLDEVTDIQERICAGEIVPAGQCPDCGCLAHLIAEPTPDASGLLAAAYAKETGDLRQGITTAIGMPWHQMPSGGAVCPDDKDIIAAAAAFRASLTELTDWMREHTGPNQPNSPHAILVRAVNLLSKGA